MAGEFLKQSKINEHFNVKRERNMIHKIKGNKENVQSTCGGDQTHINFRKIELSLNVKGSLEGFPSSS
jgi:hypothetical protein